MDSGHITEPAGVQEVSKQCSQANGPIFGCSVVEAGAGLSDSYWSFLTPAIL